MRRSKHGGITYRPLLKEDIEKLEQLQIALFPVKYTPIFYQKLFHDGYHCIVAVTDEGQIIGVASARLCDEECTDYWCYWVKSVPGYIMTIGVDETYRGQGIGGILLDKICTVLIQKKCKYVYLHVKVGNEAATQFYLKHNFTVEEEIENYYTIDKRPYNSLRLGKNIASQNGGKQQAKRLWRWVFGVKSDNDALKKKEAVNV